MIIGFTDNTLGEINFDDWVMRPIGYKLCDYIPTGIYGDINSFPQLNCEVKENQSFDEIMDRIINKLDSVKIKREEWGFFIGDSELVNAREDTFKKLLFLFYELCLNDKRRYNENLFRAIMSIYDFHVPWQKIRFQEYDAKSNMATEIRRVGNFPHEISDLSVEIAEITKLHDSQTLHTLRVYNCKPNQDEDEMRVQINYFMAVSYELVKQGYHVNKCECCGKWFVAMKKSDTKYCQRTSPQNKNKTCQDAMIYQKQQEREKNDMARSIYKSRYAVLSKKYGGSSQELSDFAQSASEWKIKIKSGFANNQEYIDWLQSLRERGSKNGKHQEAR